ncbi:MAG: hypothetical protein J6A35_05180, partial [Paludibacteraceae bacterium]|nr:hypothetical protein [Paludibacteraceae bacterium]
ASFPLSFSKPPRYYSDTTLLPLYHHPILSPYHATYPPLDSLISSTSSAATYQLQAHSADLQRSELPPVTRHLSCARR